MKLQEVAKIGGGQDGAIFGTTLFRLRSKGQCSVYDFSAVHENEVREWEPLDSFVLDRAETIVPHSNSVCFGTEFYEDGDEFPLLYSNIYNNYAKTEDPLIGVCCVYRIQRVDQKFQTALVQLIEIGFCEDAALWKASEEKHGARPYGNFLIDGENHALYAYVMRNEELGTRYFQFDLPSVHSGEVDPKFNVRRVILTPDHILDQFDCSYHRYIQGGGLERGCIYSTEGFEGDEINRPAIRLIRLDTHEETYLDLMEYGMVKEPEMIVFYEGVCYYSDAHGTLYRLEF